MKITLSALVLALACTAAHAETPEDRCEHVAAYAQSVAEVRDQGMRLREVLEIVDERAADNMVDAYKIAAKIVYKNANASPAEVHAGILAGCLNAVKAEKARRAGALKTSF